MDFVDGMDRSSIVHRVHAVHEVHLHRRSLRAPVDHRVEPSDVDLEEQVVGSGLHARDYGGGVRPGHVPDPRLEGHLLCYDNPDPAGVKNIVDEIMVNGNPSLSYDCTGAGKRLQVASWWESRAQ